MVENLEVVVAVTKKMMMKLLVYLFIFFPILVFSQETTDTTTIQQDTNKVYKKRVLENVEVNLISSYYTQDGEHASVTGGIGDEHLTDFASTIDVSIPLNDDDIFVIDATVSAYTSASSSNLNPFSGASQGGDDDENEGNQGINNTVKGPTTGTPWAASTGASKSDVWVNGNLSYSHYSDDRNNIVSANISVANEFDYTSFGFGAGYTHLFNKKNTEIGIKANIYLDYWRPQYPTEIHTYIENNGNLEAGFFNGVDILDHNGLVADENGALIWAPFKNTLVDNSNRNTYSFTLSFSQIISKNAQFSIFTDVVTQQGWLANPMQRVYFKDKANYYIGTASSIVNYISPTNLDVFQLADDIERLPETRLKTPVGIRFNYYISELFVFKTYYRYYFDDWGIKAHTANIELPIKIAQKFTFYPTYRFYSQIAADYFAPYEEHLSTDKFYTSDFDLSKFNANQYGFGIKYNDIFTKAHIGMMRLKTVDLNYSYYHRNTGLKANIVSFGMKFIVN
jgi:hypothetical protein